MNIAFAIYRYFVFAVFTACNIGTCVVAAKIIYIALILRDGSIVEIDALLIALASVGLAFMLPVLVMDILRKNSVIRHVWFECLWIGIFCIMQLASAGVVTVTMSGFECIASISRKGVITFRPCAVATLMIAFTWAAAANFYVLVLTIITLLHKRDNPLIWSACVAQYPWFTARREPRKEQPASLLLVQSVLNSGQLRLSRHDIDPEKQATAASLRVPPMTATPRRRSVQKSPRSSGFSPRRFVLSTGVSLSSPRTATGDRIRRTELPAGAAIGRAHVPMKRPREPQKRISRLHRPPSLDLSRIGRSW
ncbi:hypothetical protein DAEQUDRAFT_769051 [Daedalea quercina L-15889]|uniref:Uncharacterized protein n=1 Tax=Daedalea quercina L-15889 TaxID=1314783 RepID=A0A165M3W2_9APHY|nr:hypothetical protein DAEQUDRAFT_769051 [Daedalea quercina L-15889]